MTSSRKNTLILIGLMAGTYFSVSAFYSFLARHITKNEPAPSALTCEQRLERDEQHLSFRVSTPGQYLERHSNTMRLVRRADGWMVLGDNGSECDRSFVYGIIPPARERLDAYYACMDSIRTATTVVMDIAGADTTEAFRTRIWLTGLSPEMAAARIAAQKDSMYCSWLRFRREDCVEAAKQDSVRAWLEKQGGAYVPCEGACK